MKTHVNGQAAARTAAPTAQAQRLADLRFMVLDAVTYSPYATADEKARTAASVARCQDETTLLKWYANVLTVISDRELAPPVFATTEQKQEIIKLLNYPAVSRPTKTKVLRGINCLTETQAVDLIAQLTAVAFPEPTPPTRPAGAGLVVNRRGQLAVAALLSYASRAVSRGGVATSYGQAA
ncbi:hypothetical protein [Hymenobacter negativus]|uniref:Uncharacterized protein n=1 Tax=Hymenobacter negativus TaxID=2795026 RepID=A0ABS3QI69_9BACT|nr:hypothetical protein [Hymenobacter negativus]MBO2010867.1 hypothetical protein [Hymenobacter negativus]